MTTQLTLITADEKQLTIHVATTGMLSLKSLPYIHHQGITYAVLTARFFDAYKAARNNKAPGYYCEYRPVRQWAGDAIIFTHEASEKSTRVLLP